MRATVTWDVIKARMRVLAGFRVQGLSKSLGVWSLYLGLRFGMLFWGLRGEGFGARGFGSGAPSKLWSLHAERRLAANN